MRETACTKAHFLGGMGLRRVKPFSSKQTRKSPSVVKGGFLLRAKLTCDAGTEAGSFPELLSQNKIG